MDEATWLEGSDEPICMGGPDCRADIHIHGCYSDRAGARCDAPDEHMHHIGGGQQ